MQRGTCFKKRTISNKEARKIQQIAWKNFAIITPIPSRFSHAKHGIKDKTSIALIPKIWMTWMPDLVLSIQREKERN